MPRKKANLLLAPFNNLPCHIHTAGSCLGEAAGYAGTVTDGEDVFEFRFELIGELYAGTVEFYFYAVEQGVVIGHARGNLVECLNHFDEVIYMPLGQNQ